MHEGSDDLDFVLYCSRPWFDTEGKEDDIDTSRRSRLFSSHTEIEAVLNPFIFIY